MSEEVGLARGPAAEANVAEIERQFQEEFADFEAEALGTRTRSQDVLLLQRQLMNEKAAPDILQYQTELVDSLKQAIEKQQDLVDEMKGNVKDMVRCMLYQMELDRVKYVVVEYLRVRLRKIHKYYLHITKNNHARLSMSEARFAKGLFELETDHLSLCVTSKLPRVRRRLAEETSTVNMVARPAMESYVFCRVMSDLGDVDVGENLTPANMNKGDIFAIRYAPIEGLVEVGDVLLI